MGNVIDYLERVSKLDYVETLTKVWNDPRVQQRIIELNTEEQLFKSGIDSEGVTLGNYSPVSVEKYGKPEGHIRLFDTGEFFESFRVIVFGEDAKITANTKKEDIDLAVEFGKEIIGLTNDSKKHLTETISQVLREIVRDYLRVS